MTLRVILQVIPHGIEEAAYEIGRLDIFNKGPFEVDCHAYGVIDLTPHQEGLHNKTIYHYQGHGAWYLVKKVLTELDIR